MSENYKDLVLKAPTFKNSHKIISDIKEDQNLILTSFFGLMIGVAASDGKIKNREIQYLKRECYKWIDIEKNQTKNFINLNIYAFKKVTKFEDYLPSFARYLNEVFDNDSKKDLLETLFVISRSDLEIDESEIKVLKVFSEIWDLSDAIFEGTKASAQKIVDQKLGTDFSIYEFVQGSEKFTF
jgi:uncharacterized tellurite resistance protein B-like protein